MAMFCFMEVFFPLDLRSDLGSWHLLNSHNVYRTGSHLEMINVTMTERSRRPDNHSILQGGFVITIVQS